MANQLLSIVGRRETLPESYIRPESDRPRLAEVTTDNNIPLIDLASPDKQLVVDQIGQACRTYCFFQVPSFFFDKRPLAPLLIESVNSSPLLDRLINLDR
jgi:hypothetical protein